MFLQGGLLLGGAALVNGFVIEPKSIEVEERTVSIEGLSPAFDGLRLCQVTDVHHGASIGLRYIESVVEMACSLKPDAVVFTGDYADEKRKYLEPVVKALSAIKAKWGPYAVLGNHDHYVGASYTRDVLESHGIKVLQNSHIMIESRGGALAIAGVRDYLEDRPDAALALKGIDRAVPRILLSHHPDYCEKLPSDRVDLVLAGHTHGGQVRLPFSFAPVVPSDYGQKYSGGLVSLNRPFNTKVYVSRGIGVSIIPVRVNCPPELTLITLKARGPERT